MNVITIPKNMAKNDDLVIIPRKEYEEMKVRVIPVFYLKGKKAEKLDSRVKKALEEYRAGKAEKLEDFLRREHTNLYKIYGS